MLRLPTLPGVGGGALMTTLLIQLALTGAAWADEPATVTAEPVAATASVESAAPASEPAPVTTAAPEAIQAPSEATPAGELVDTTPKLSPPLPAPPPAPHRFVRNFGDSGWFIDTTGSIRYIGATHPDFVVDPYGTKVGQDFALDSRYRLALGAGWKGLRAETQWDFLTGQVAGDTWDLPVTLDARRRDDLTATSREGIVPRRASLTARSDDGFIIEAGLVPATTWGLGMLANGGEGDPLFGRTDRGDRMLRFRMTAFPFSHGDQPLPIFLTVAFDRVVEDDTARWRDGQIAYQVVGSLLWADPLGRKGGVFYTYRTQTEPGDVKRPTDVSAIDGYVDMPLALGDSGWKARFAAEGAGLVGSTQRTLTYADPTSTKIRSGGFAALVSFDAPNSEARVQLRGGFASASGDPDSSKLQDFTFDSNYDVGMILFDELMGGVEAGTYALLTDTTNAGRPPYGADGLLTEGSFRRATYIQPAITYAPIDWLEVRLGYVAAWGTGPIAQPFTTFRNGGTPTNHLGQETHGNYMGSEIDWAVGLGRGPHTLPWWFRPRLVVQGAAAIVGKNLGGGTLNQVMITGQVDW